MQNCSFSLHESTVMCTCKIACERIH